MKQIDFFAECDRLERLVSSIYALAVEDRQWKNTRHYVPPSLQKRARFGVPDLCPLYPVPCPLYPIL